MRRLRLRPSFRFPTTSSVASSEIPGAEAIAERSLALLLAFLALAEFEPSEPFLTDFLVSKGLTKDQVSNELFSLWLYFRLPALLAAGLVAEYLGSARMLFIGALFGCITASMTLWCTSLFFLKVTQLTVAISVASHTGAFFAVLFELSARTDRGSQVHVHYAKAVLVLSNSVAGFLGSLLRRAFTARYGVLFGITLVAQMISLLIAAALVQRTAVFRDRSSRAGALDAALSTQVGPAEVRRFAVWRDVASSFRLLGVAEWTCWSVAMHTGHVLVTTYWQPLLREKTHRKQDWNGLANSAGYLLGALALIASSRMHVLADPGYRRRAIVTSMTLCGILIVAMGSVRGVLLFYSCFAVFQAVFRLSSAAATQQVGAEVRGREAAAESARLEAVRLTAPACASEGAACPPAAAAPPLPRARLALLVSATEVLGSCAQGLAQLAFGAWRTPGGARQPLSSGFVALGVGLVVAAAIFAIGVGVAAARRRSTAATAEPFG